MSTVPPPAADRLHEHGRHRPGRRARDDGEDEDRSADRVEQAEESGEWEGDGIPLVSVPRSLRRVDVQVGARAVRGLLVVAAVVLAVLAGRWWWAQQEAGAVPVVASPGGGAEGGETGEVRGEGAPGEGAAGAAAPEGAVGGGAAGAGPSGGASATAAAPVTVVVHVVGQVRRPGVVQLPAGSRVDDAVEAAGGFTEKADRAALNLARPLVDGEQLWVGAPGEEPPAGIMAGAGPGRPAGGPGGAGGGEGGAAAPGSAAAGSGTAPLDLNLATQAELEELPGVGPVTAGHILAWREQHGRFSSIDELMEVSGIGERTFAQLEPLVSVGG